MATTSKHKKNLKTTDRIPVANTGSSNTEAQYVSVQQILDEVPAPTADYLVYTAIVSQASTDAPTAIVLKNTLGGTVEYAYNASGNYQVTATGLLTVGKTFCTVSGNNQNAVYAFSHSGVNGGRLYVRDNAGVDLDDHTAIYLEFRVYP